MRQIERDVIAAAEDGTTASEIGRRIAVAYVEAEMAEMERTDAPPSGAPTINRFDGAPGTSSGARTSVSRQFSVRLSHDQFDALTRRADRVGIPAGALARNLIAIGLTRLDGGELAETVDQLEVAVASLRRLVA